jgi:two-component system cell cycle response regulator
LTARILIVDDVASSGRLLEACLTGSYYDVKFISDSSVVEATLKVWEPDVILLDIVMPGIDGYEVCRLIKINPATAHIPVIMVTVLKDQSERRRALAAGADEFLVKPVESEILLARLRGIIRLKQLLDELRANGRSVSALGLFRNGLSDSTVPKATALIVEDLPSRSLWVQNVFVRGGIAGEAVDNEVDALSVASQCNFHLIVISLSLMNGNPLRLLASLRASVASRDVPIILMAEDDKREMLNFWSGFGRKRLHNGSTGRCRASIAFTKSYSTQAVP